MFLLLLGDGLGHGPEANKAVTQAGEAFMKCHEKDPTAIIRHINASVKKTRGLVGTVDVAVDTKERMWRVCGIGNVRNQDRRRHELERLYGV